MSKADDDKKFQMWIPPELYFRVRRRWPHGMQKAVMQKLLEDVTGIMEAADNPEQVAGAILKGDIHLARRER